MEADDHRPPGRAAHHLDRDLDRLGAVEGDVEAADARRRDRQQPLAELGGELGGERVAVLVAEPPQRLDRRLEQLRAPGAERHRGGGRGAVEVDVAVGVGDRPAALRGERERRQPVGEARDRRWRPIRSRISRLRGPGGSAEITGASIASHSGGISGLIGALPQALRARLRGVAQHLAGAVAAVGAGDPAARVGPGAAQPEVATGVR